jgi:hypothetical protein
VYRRGRGGDGRRRRFVLRENKEEGANGRHLYLLPPVTAKMQLPFLT